MANNRMLDFSRFGIYNLAQYENVIGLDFGDGETSAAMLNIRNIMDSPRPLLFDERGHEKIATALFIGNDGAIRIGTQALNHEKGKGVLYTNFKANPFALCNEIYEGSNIAKKELVQKYIKAVIDTLFRINNIERETALVLVGCPSSEDWLENNRDVEYSKILSKGVGSRVVVMAESRASLIKNFHETSNSKKFYEIIVFDFGSSTADATYISIQKTYLKDYSEKLGAHHIEKKMLEKLLLEAQRSMDELYYEESNVKLSLRETKENFYNEPDRRQHIFISFDEGNDFSKRYNFEFVEEITRQEEICYATSEEQREGSWKALCETFFATVKEKFEIDPNFNGLIILTGGASRMPFIEEICRGVFSNAQITKDAYPSHCVSKGLALAGKTDIKAQLLLDEINENIGKIINDKIGFLENNIKGHISKKCFEILVSRANSWAENYWGTTIKDLVDSTKDNIRRTDIEQAINGAFDTFVNKGVYYYRDYYSLKGIKTLIVNLINSKIRELYPNNDNEIEFQTNNQDWISLQSTMVDSFQINIDTIANIIGTWTYGCKTLNIDKHRDGEARKKIARKIETGGYALKRVFCDKLKGDVKGIIDSNKAQLLNTITAMMKNGILSTIDTMALHFSHKN
jgi:hypothetical protein